MFRIIITILFSLAVLDHVNTYRILGIFPLNSYSHEMMFKSLMKGLAKHGHQVDVVTHFPIKNPPPNYKNVVNLSGTLENIINNFTIPHVMSFADNIAFAVGHVYGNRLCDLMEMKEFQHLIHNPPNDPPYDLLIVEAFGANCFMGIGHHFNIPIIAASSAVEYPWVSDFVGNNDNPAIVPNSLYMVFGQMNFWQRLKNTLMYRNEIRKFHSYTEDSQTESMRKYINPNSPNIRDVEKTVALTLVNSHPLLYGVKPVTPTLVQVAGLHVDQDDLKLTPELKKWLDESKDGVVYFTFGSMVLVETLPENTLKILYSSFTKIAPVRVLMKIADKNKLPPGLPSNVLTSSWLPQQPILAHKNTKAFITHGGLMGSQEALYYGVPMIGIPLFADQFRNVAAFVAKNMSIKLSLSDISEESLDSALKSVLFDAKYRKYANHYSRLFRDRPMNAMETAVFWIEYIIRNGPDVMRSPALNFTWWQLALLDVYCFIFLVFVSSKVILYYLVKFIWKKVKLHFILKDQHNEKKIK